MKLHAAVSVCLSLLAPLSALEVRPGGEAAGFIVALTPEQRRAIGRGRPAQTDRALCAVAVPVGFDPARPWPVLVVSSTSDPGYNSSRLWLRERYAATALAAGWVVLAADPPTPQPPALDTPELRFALVESALDALARDWPGARDWPLAFGGFSGGSKHSVFLAAQSARAGRVVAGLFLGGCNDDASTTALNLFSPPRRTFRRIPVFISGGDRDEVATPAGQARVEGSMHGNGFVQVRRETYAGGHEFHAPHLAVALRWFDGLRAGPTR